MRKFWNVELILPLIDSQAAQISLFVAQNLEREILKICELNLLAASKAQANQTYCLLSG
jgi:hypothetical protein